MNTEQWAALARRWLDYERPRLDRSPDEQLPPARDQGVPPTAPPFPSEAPQPAP